MVEIRSIKKIFTITSLSVILLACSDNYQEVYYEDGSLKYKAPLKGGVPHGEAILYDENGNVSQRTNWVNGKKEGLTTTYFSNGKVNLKVNFSNGHEDGLLEAFDSLGNKIREGVYVKGKLNGKTIEYFKSGSIKRELNLINNKLTGICKEFYKEGALKSYKFYKGESIIYAKDYSKTGDLEGAAFPLEISHSDEDYTMTFEILHTNVENIELGLIIGEFDEQQNITDTIYRASSEGMVIQYKPSNLVKGSNTIKGEIYEIDGKTGYYEIVEPFSYDLKVE